MDFSLPYLENRNIFSAKNISSLLEIDFFGNSDENILGLCDPRYLADDRLLVVAPNSFTENLIAKNLFFLIEETDLIAKNFLEKRKKRFFVVPSGKSKSFLIKLLNIFKPKLEKKYLLSEQDFSVYKEYNINIHSSAMIEPGVVCGEHTHIGAGVHIGANAVLGARVFVGEHTIIHPGVVLYDGVFVGDHCVVHGGSVLGADGFGYDFVPEGLVKVPQIGRVFLGNNVEIGANVTIDRATISLTKISDRVKIDNLVQIAHNVQIDCDTLIVAQTGIAGSSVLGKNVIIAGQVGIADHCVVGDGTKIGPQSGVPSRKKLPSGAKLLGSPVMDVKQWVACKVALEKLSKK